MKHVNTGFCKILMALVLVSSTSVFASLPVNSKDKNTAAVWYGYELHGEFMGASEDDVQFEAHRVNYALAPIEYVELGVGVGAGKIQLVNAADEFSSDQWEVTTNAHILLSTPGIINDHLRLKLGGAYHYWIGYDANDMLEVHSFAPMGMLTLNFGRVYIDLGGLGLMSYGKNSIGDRDEENYETQVLPRGLLSIMYTDPNWWFMRVQGTASADAGDWVEGPQEATLKFEIGTYLKNFKHIRGSDDLEAYFPRNKELRQRQDEMEKEFDEDKEESEEEKEDEKAK